MGPSTFSKSFLLGSSLKISWHNLITGSSQKEKGMYGMDICRYILLMADWSPANKPTKTSRWGFLVLETV